MDVFKKTPSDPEFKDLFNMQIYSRAGDAVRLGLLPNGVIEFRTLVKG